MLNEVFVIYAAQKMPGDVLSIPMLLEIQSIEARIRATPGFNKHCAVRHDDHASYSAGPRVCAPPIGATGFFFNASNGELAPNVTERALALAESAIAPNLADRWFGEDGQLASNASGAHFFFHGDGVDFDEWATTTLYPRLKTASTKHVRVLWTNPTLDAHEISLTLATDSLWCIGSIFFVAAALAYHTRSLSIALAALSGIFAAFLLAFWLYTRVMGVTEMPMLNFLSIFVLLGIGADDILVVTDTFRLVSTEEATKDEPCSVRMREALGLAGSAMLVTSVTSAASFYANLASVLPALRSFGVFMGTVIVTNYIMVIVAFPPILVLRDHAQKQNRKDAEEQKRRDVVADAARRAAEAGSVILAERYAAKLRRARGD